MRRLWPTICALALVACAPKLTAPHESIRLSGTVTDPALPVATDPKGKPPRRLPVGVVVYETCSKRFLVIDKCPGNFLGETKLAKTGHFLIEVDSEAPSLTVFAFRGYLGQEQACSQSTLAPADAAKSLDLALAPGPCPVRLKRPY